MGQKVPGFSKAREGAAGNRSSPRTPAAAPISGLPAQCRTQGASKTQSPAATPPRSPGGRQQGFWVGCGGRSLASALALSAVPRGTLFRQLAAVSGTRSSCHPLPPLHLRPRLPRSPPGDPAIPASARLPWPSSEASTRLSAPYPAARLGAAPSGRIVAAVTPPIASPGPTPAAPSPGPPQAAL